MARKGKRRCDHLPVLHPDATGIDIGANELFVAVPAEGTQIQSAGLQPSQDLNALADWLHRCGVRSGGHGIYKRLLDPGVPDPGAPRVPSLTVECNHVETFRAGRQMYPTANGFSICTQLVSFGAAFVPLGVIYAIRSLWRQRASLIQMAAEHVLHMQKALDQMNVQIHRVLNDIVTLSLGAIALNACARNPRMPACRSLLCYPYPSCLRARNRKRRAREI